MCAAAAKEALKAVDGKGGKKENDGGGSVGDGGGRGSGGDDADGEQDKRADKEKEEMGKEGGLSLLQTQGHGVEGLRQQQRAIVAALVAQHIESGDYASARALLEPTNEVEILKSQLAAHLTPQFHYRAYF